MHSICDTDVYFHYIFHAVTWFISRTLAGCFTSPRLFPLAARSPPGLAKTPLSALGLKSQQQQQQHSGSGQCLWLPLRRLPIVVASASSPLFYFGLNPKAQAPRESKDWPNYAGIRVKTVTHRVE